MTIAQLVYASKPSKDSQFNVEELLVTARTRNKQVHVTGYLCFRPDRFLQVLEGSPAAVSALYSRIVNDRRHSDVVLLGYEKVVRRRFSTWAMGYVADLRDAHGILVNYSGQNDFEPYEMDSRSAVEFLSEVASEAARRTATRERM